MRVFTRAFSAVLAAAIAVVCLLAAVEIVLALAARGPWLVDARPWFEDASADAWSTPTHRLILALTLAAGIILLLVAWSRRRPVTVAAVEDRMPDDVEVTLRRRDVERRLEASAREVPYVLDATARVDKRISLVAGSTRRADQAIHDEVEAEVRRVAEQLALDPGPTRVRVRSSAGRAA